MSTLIVLAAGGLLLLPVLLTIAAGIAFEYGRWELARALFRFAKPVLGVYGGTLAFHYEVVARRETGDLDGAVALAEAAIAPADAFSGLRNVAVDVLINAGRYEDALKAERPPQMPRRAVDALSLILLQINLAEAEYNLGRWDAAEARLRNLELACWPYPIARAGLLQQRAWIAAHHGRADEALRLCAQVKPTWLPGHYRAEYHFTRAVGFLTARRWDDAEAAIVEGERVAIRQSSKRNAMFLRARVAAGRGDWVAAEVHCRAAAQHVFRGQGGDGLLLWATALTQLGRVKEAEEVRGLVSQRDPESEAARARAAAHGAACG